MQIVLHTAYFLFYLVLLRLGYTLLDITLPILHKGYVNIHPSHKKIYVCSNVLKSLMFCFYTTDALYLLYCICVKGTWDVERVQYLGLLYTGLDTMSLYMVPKMQLNTKIHHLSVMVLHSYCMFYNYEVGEMLKIIIVYAIWSANAYCVNLYLGLRVFIREKNTYLHYLCCAALFTYVGCCIMNWSYQAYKIGGMMYDGTFPIGGYLYQVTMAFIIYDDIVLMKFLYSRIKNYYINRAKSAQKLQDLLTVRHNSNPTTSEDTRPMLVSNNIKQNRESGYTTNVYERLYSTRRF